jgi:hypothetical protein
MSVTHFIQLLWDELRSKNPERIQQVWFAGVHSDVGGGYPDDSASYKPLEWMMDQAAAARLTFVPYAVKEIRRTAMSTGPMYDWIPRHRRGGYPKPAKPEPNRDFERTPPSAVRAIFG